MTQTLRTCSLLSLSVVVAVFSAGCTSKASQGAAPAFPPSPVTVLTVDTQDVPIYREYAAETYARDMVDIRGRVDGYIDKRLFSVGSDVRAGQPLYELDQRPYLADVAKAKGDLQQAYATLEFAKKQVGLVQAQADLEQAKATALKSHNDVARLAPLVKQEAAPTQDLDDANAAVQANDAAVSAKKANVDQNRLSTKTQIDTASAQVESQKALLRTAELNLEYSIIRAPIGGRVGDTLIPVGGLVSKTAAQPLTTVVPLDPIWVRFKVSESEYIATAKRGGAEVTKLPLELVLADGAVFPQQGRIQNTVNQVDSKTGTLELQATFPNPRHTLLPGQFGRVRLRVDDRKNAILVPQRALQELQGLQSVFTVNSQNLAEVRSVVMGERIGADQIVEQGLKSGDRVIVGGAQKVRPGAPVSPQPYQPAPNTGRSAAGI